MGNSAEPKRRVPDGAGSRIFCSANVLLPGNTEDLLLQLPTRVASLLVFVLACLKMTLAASSPAWTSLHGTSAAAGRAQSGHPPGSSSPPGNGPSVAETLCLPRKPSSSAAEPKGDSESLWTPPCRAWYLPASQAE